MDLQTKKKMDARARILKALAHPTRLFMVDELSRGPRCVAELTQMVQADISTVSKHLSVLKNAGVLRGTKKGTQVYYDLATPCVMDFFSCLENILEANVQAQIDGLG
ncbi:ArsR/SmtB family transcription factor [Dethiosulfatarculus sandiegensis]|uniref:ArsR family transcriptional regulator n=1 Tax=Dethiosulfatarculus sandiegensis TaxID=1429043 RepID=A0A0D2J4V0_9BACT|nr:metalloregulator ArsR/SmtB family transcription factor [Dethiosulfatarculus sandiegensis]KIX10751.1 ArsR family transcriptional regulator [Dethiosulfatarculus sandiegensis]